MASTPVELQPQPQPHPHEVESQQIDEATPPPTAANVLETWNQSKSNICRTLATFWSFLVMGANDAAYGVS